MTFYGITHIHVSSVLGSDKDVVPVAGITILTVNDTVEMSVVVDRNPRVFFLRCSVVPVNFIRTFMERRGNRRLSAVVVNTESLASRSLKPSLEGSGREENLVESPLLEISGESVAAVMIMPVVVAISLRSKGVISSRMPVFSSLDSANEYPSHSGEHVLSGELTLLEVGVAVAS